MEAGHGESGLGLDSMMMMMVLMKRMMMMGMTMKIIKPARKARGPEGPAR